MKNAMIDRYKELIRGLLPEINDEEFLHEIYVDLLVHVEKNRPALQRKNKNFIVLI